MQTRFFVLVCLAAGALACSNFPDEPNRPVRFAGNHDQIGMPENARVVYRSTDEGRTWTGFNEGLPEKAEIFRAYLDQSVLYLNGRNTVYHRDLLQAGSTWEKENLYEAEISDIFQGITSPYWVSYNKGVYKKLMGAEALIPVFQHLEDKRVRTMLEYDAEHILVGTEKGIYKSRDGGQSWNLVFDQCGINNISGSGNLLMAAAYTGVLRSTDGGEHWEQVLQGVGSAYRAAYEAGKFMCIAVENEGDGNKAPVFNLCMSADGGDTWQILAPQFFQGPFFKQNEAGAQQVRQIHDVKMAGKYLFCATDAGIFRSYDLGQTWELVLEAEKDQIFNLVVQGQNLYAVAVIGC